MGLVQKVSDRLLSCTYHSIGEGRYFDSELGDVILS